MNINEVNVAKNSIPAPPEFPARLKPGYYTLYIFSESDYFFHLFKYKVSHY